MAENRLTLDEVIQRLTELSTTYPECRQRPVQMLVINGTGLVAEVFLECHDADEGEREPPHRTGVTGWLVPTGSLTSSAHAYRDERLPVSP